MRILVLSWRDLQSPRAGGAERVTFEHMRRWAAAGHDVTLFTASYAGAAAEDEWSGVRIIRRASEKTIHLAAQHWFRRQRQPVDLIVDEIHGLPFCSIPLVYAGIPRIAWIFEVLHDIWFSMYPLPVASVGRIVEKATLRWYGHCRIPFVTDSQSAAADLVASGIGAEHITVIAPAIDRAPLPHLPEKERRPTLIVVGRIVRSKRVEDALTALAHVRRQAPDCQLWIIGAGADDYVAELRRLAAQLAVADSVQFLGRVDEEEKYARLARAHVLIHPSQREGWGINVIEANAMGTPAVGYRVPGLRDSIMHGETGLLCPPRDPLSMAEHLRSLLAAPSAYRLMQERALAWSSRFTWDAAAARSLEVIARVTGGSGAPAAAAGLAGAAVDGAVGRAALVAAPLPEVVAVPATNGHRNGRALHAPVRAGYAR